MFTQALIRILPLGKQFVSVCSTLKQVLVCVCLYILQDGVVLFCFQFTSVVYFFPNLFPISPLFIETQLVTRSL